MIDYSIVILQLALLASLLFVSACAITIIGTSVGLWLLGKSVEICSLIIDQTKLLYVRIEKGVKSWVS